jgi:hypothetical protein
MYAKAVPEGYRLYDVFYATKNRYKHSLSAKRVVLSVVCDRLNS